MALPTYATTGQRVGYYTFLTYCGLVFFFLIAPIFIILPLSFSASPFFEFTREFMHFEPEAWSLRWYRQMVGISSIGDTTVVTNKWMLGTRNSFFVGISAGCMLVFILAIGYYITPELVGGKDGQMIGNWIAYHLKTTLNWGLCAALGAILLGVLTVLYWVYNKLVGIENIKLG